MDFPTHFESIIQRIELIDPVKYSSTRNYLNGAVTYLSPYISRGVISTKDVLKHLVNKGHTWNEMEKLIQELAWRDYWQQVWIAKGEVINNDLRKRQEQVESHDVSEKIINAQTGIQAIDEGIDTLYNTGYMHNHMRMYVGALACNVAKNHWKTPAQWMYYHLLDGDWASNALSWQWIAGSNSNKKYFANQENINKFTGSKQLNTYLDQTYDALPSMPVPNLLKDTKVLKLETSFPATGPLSINDKLPTLIYNYYNLDPNWHSSKEANRVFLVEPSVFRNYPIGKKAMDFAMKLAHQIKGMQVFVGEFEDLKSLGAVNLIYKEHPLNKYSGKEEPRDWICSVTGYYPSFFKFWKQCQKELKSTLFG